MKIFQRYNVAYQGYPQGAVAAVLLGVLGASLLGGCSASGDPANPFVENANAEPSDGGLVNLSQADENFSQGSAQIKPLEKNAISRVAGGAFDSKGERVSAIDFMALSAKSNWQYVYYMNYPVRIDEQSFIGHKAISGTGSMYRTENDASFEECGAIPVASSLTDEIRYPPAAPEACSLGEVEARFYQSTQQITAEYYCADNLVSARTYHLIPSERSGVAQLEFSLLKPPQDYSDTNACLEVANYWVANEESQINTVADIYGNILNDSYHIQFQLNHISVEQSFFTLDSTAGEQHDFVFNFSPFGRYSSTQDETGFVLLERDSNPFKLNAEFEIVVDDVVEGERQIEGYIQTHW